MSQSVESNAVPIPEFAPTNPAIEWADFVKKANVGEITRDEARHEFSRLIKEGNPFAIKEQSALNAADKSQGKVKPNSAYEKGEVLYHPMSGDSTFMSG
jgi:hypothetical protein